METWKCNVGCHFPCVSRINTLVILCIHWPIFLACVCYSFLWCGDFESSFPFLISLVVFPFSNDCQFITKRKKKKKSRCWVCLHAHEKSGLWSRPFANFEVFKFPHFYLWFWSAVIWCMIGSNALYNVESCTDIFPILWTMRWNQYLSFTDYIRNVK